MRLLNFGCGIDVRPGYENVDISPFPGVDRTFDFSVFPYPYESNTFDSIYADNVLEHLADIPSVMKELHRIAKDAGTIRILVPYYNCYGAHNDLTHRHTFSAESFEPFYNGGARGNYFMAERFTLLHLYLVPTRLGKLIPCSYLRKRLSYVFGQLIHLIDIELRVEKSS